VRIRNADSPTMSNDPLSSINERQRFASPAPAPQALCWRNGILWMGSRDLRRIYGIEAESWKVVKEGDVPGIPWAATSTDRTICFTIGEGIEDDRYLQQYSPEEGFWSKDRIACPDFTGSYLSYDGRHVYLSQWYRHRILKLDTSGNILREYQIDAEISGHTFFDGTIYVLRGTEQGGEDWRIARLNPHGPGLTVEDLATVPFPCRSLAFDGSHFWANHRAANEIVCFDLPE
jgi:hypothetical protein